MKYYAIIDGEQSGPYTLEELVDKGIGPDTYVWSKGMSDWERADEVADICRHYRQRLSRLQHPAPLLPSIQTDPSGPEPVPVSLPDPAEHDPDMPPPHGMLLAAILATLFCFPFTGIIAIYYSVRARNAWQESQRARSDVSAPLYNDRERENLQSRMTDAVRYSKMWTGISVFLGFLLYATMFRII